jgi:hypothetical protein
VPYRGRKSTTTQNVMYMVDFDLCFTYIYAGWEGFAHDSRVFIECINDPQCPLSHPSWRYAIFIECINVVPCMSYENVFSFVDYHYLVDSGYGCLKGFLPPHRNELYHQEAFHKSGVKTKECNGVV